MAEETEKIKELVVDMPLQQTDIEIPQQIKIRFNKTNAVNIRPLCECGCGSSNGAGAGSG
jgi:hypothetical protein